MTSEQWWTSPPPTPPPRRYATGSIWLGLAVGLAATIGIPMLGFFLAVQLEQAALGWLFGLVSFGPLVLGIVLAAGQGTPARRGFGLGLTIGWACAPIIFSGVCILIILGAYTIPNFPGV